MAPCEEVITSSSSCSTAPEDEPEQLEAREEFAKSTIPYVSEHDMHIERCIGKGSFASVYRVRFKSKSARRLSLASTDSTAAFHCDEITTSTTCFHEDSSNTDGGDNCGSSSLDLPGGRCLALKRLSPKTLASDPNTVDVARKDLAMEATMLLKLPPHDNIVTLHALSHNFWTDITRGFLVLSKLSETLNCRLERWRKERSYEVAVPAWSVPFVQKLYYQKRYEREQVDRATLIGLPVARAMAFLHSHKVCYRDLKPSNCGFDEMTGQVRLFDFGLAREHQGVDDERTLTGFTGTSRYMAPVR